MTPLKLAYIRHPWRRSARRSSRLVEAPILLGKHVDLALFAFLGCLLTLRSSWQYVSETRVSAEAFTSRVASRASLLADFVFGGTGGEPSRSAEGARPSSNAPPLVEVARAVPAFVRSEPDARFVYVFDRAGRLEAGWNRCAEAALSAGEATPASNVCSAEERLAAPSWESRAERMAATGDAEGPPAWKGLSGPVGLSWALARTTNGGAVVLGASNRAEQEERFRRHLSQFFIVAAVVGAGVFAFSLFARLRVRAFLGELEANRMRLVTSASDVALGRMASGVSHEINNPLTVVYGKAVNLRVLAADPATSAEALRARVTKDALKIEQAVFRIYGITNALRIFAEGRLEEKIADASVQDILRNALALCEEKFRHSGINVQLDVPLETLRLRCRPQQLTEVLLHLLHNAHDALTSSDAQEKPMVRVRALRGPSGVIIAVENNGPPIPAAVAEKIYEPFFSTKGAGQATGLGLAVSLGVVQAHGGRLVHESRPGLVRFEMILPNTETEPLERT